MKVTRSIREDGLQVITCKIPSTKMVRLGVTAKVGSAYDPEDKEGLFHLFEHMAFKGTTTKDITKLMLLFDRYFIDPNAYTAELYTVYGGSGYYRRINNLCDVIFDTFLNPIFPEKEIEKEKQVVHSEYARFLDSAYQRLFNQLDQLLYQHNPIRKVGIGNLESLKPITRDLLIEAHKIWYASSNAIVIAVGNVNHEKLKERAFKEFPLNKSKPPSLHWIDESNTLPPKKEGLIILSREQSLTAYGCKVPSPQNDRELLAINLMVKMLAEGFSSLLYKELRERRGLCYEVGGHHYGSGRLGHRIYFYVGTDQQKASEAKKLLLELVCNGRLSKKTFTTMKNIMMDQLRMGTQSLSWWENEILKTFVHKNQDEIYLNTFFKRNLNILKTIEFEEVIKMQDYLLKPEKMACAMVRPKE